MVEAKGIKAATRARGGGTGPKEAKAREGMMTLRHLDDLEPTMLDLPPRADAVPPSPNLSLGRMVETNGGGSLEHVPGFDAARARSFALIPATKAPCTASADPNGFVTENMIGDEDSLVPIPDTTALPWRCIAMLTITYEDGGRGVGTAWFLGENALGTAGHNIRDPKRGRATEILVSPGFDGGTAVFGTYRVQKTFCDPAWLAGSSDAALDFGVLLLDDATVGRRLGWFGIAAYEDRQLKRLLLNVSGYPTDRRNRTQHYNGGRLEDMDRTFLRYTFDTVGGMSGAPIFGLFGEQRIVVGIHTSGNDRANRARRIDEGLYRTLTSFIAP